MPLSAGAKNPRNNMPPFQIQISIAVSGTINVVHTFQPPADTKADTLAAIQAIDDQILAAKAKADSGANPTEASSSPNP